MLTVLAVSAPTFWLGSMLRHYLAFEPHQLWGWSIFPIADYRLLDPFSLALPALTLGLGGAAYYARIARTAMLGELGHGYIQTARAKGLREHDVVWKHALANVMPSLLAQVGLDLAAYLGGVAIVEQVFNWPGIGRAALLAIGEVDVSLILGTVVLGTLITVVANLLVDLVILSRDPRLVDRITPRREGAYEYTANVRPMRQRWRQSIRTMSSGQPALSVAKVGSPMVLARASSAVAWLARISSWPASAAMRAASWTPRPV